MDYPAPKEYFFRARFGWLIVGIFSAGKKKRGNYSSACSICGTTWDCYPKNTIPSQSASWEIFLRPSLTSHW
jgi:hypothetical protein